MRGACVVNTEDGTGTEVIYIAGDGSRVKVEPSAHAPKPQLKVKPIKIKISSVLKAVEKVKTPKKKVTPKKGKKKILETDGSDGANDNSFSVSNVCE